MMTQQDPWMRLADEALAGQGAMEAEQRFHDLLERLPAAAYTCDSQGLITFFNRPAEKVWGRAPRLRHERDRFCGSFRLFTPEGKPIPHDECWMARALKTGEPHNGFEIVIEQPSGAQVVALAHANPLRDRQGHLIGAVNVLVDITDRKRAEQERRELETRVFHAQKLESLGVLAGGVAHDFNNLLTVITAQATLALAEASHPSPLSSMLQEIIIASERAADLARQMLAYSGRGTFVNQHVRLDAVVREMAVLLRTIVSKGATLELDLSRACVDGDATHLRQVVMNLITNASDALAGKPGVIRIRTGVQKLSAPMQSACMAEPIPPGDYAVVEVEDSGEGMSESVLARIFDPFFTTKVGGRGLGLAAVLGIVRAHHGLVDVTSQPGHGTRFTLLLPSAVAHASVMPRANDAPSSCSNGSCGTILVVDDEDAVRRVALRVLERAGYRVLLAAGGREAQRLFREHRHEISAVVADLTMGEIGGIELIRSLRAVDPTVPALLMSGYSSEDAASISALGVPFLAKPFTANMLATTVREVLAERGGGGISAA
ncbi:ATP-binding protein [Polyangium jinanense]|uniref:histidine kinase n=1 Tax=Polyangium jinanense TaxID=2829994 RepID=A0A9X3X0Y0_9BACT|nr:ATP-binding protein [Polyangium jinanense]MDC3954482.1 response regulator [Polyangium jinanense]MDC3980785.1 response regulator [Polyangium jinanense]